MTTQNNKHACVDPVCRMNVAKTGKVPSFTFHANTYYFCADASRKAFIADPEKYVGTGAPKKKGVWGRYLERLNKATGGKPPCCHWATNHVRGITDHKCACRYSPAIFPEKPSSEFGCRVINTPLWLTRIKSSKFYTIPWIPNANLFSNECFKS